MKKLLTTVFLLAIAVLINGCDNSQTVPITHRQAHPPQLEKVTSYRTHKHSSNATTTTTTDNSWIYWYLLYDNNTHYYYSASSMSPVAPSSYSSLNWAKSANPPEEVKEPETENLGEQEVQTSELGQAETEISSDYSSIPENNSLDSMEGVPAEAGNGTTEGSSGGDSGGGGGGGGGE